MLRKWVGEIDSVGGTAAVRSRRVKLGPLAGGGGVLDENPWFNENRHRTKTAVEPEPGWNFRVPVGALRIKRDLRKNLV